VEDRRATSGPAGLEPYVDRVTMTLPTIRSASQIAFLVTGEEKAEAVSRAFQGDITADIPASLLRLAPVPLMVFLDRPAAAGLTP
jgi:6-phosphogluconolactonase